MIELIVSGSVIVILAGVICSMVERRMDRIEHKVDWLLKKAGDDYQPRNKRLWGNGNESK